MHTTIEAWKDLKSVVHKYSMKINGQLDRVAARNTNALRMDGMERKGERERNKRYLYFMCLHLCTFYLFGFYFHGEKFNSVSRQNSNGHKQTHDGNHTHNSRNILFHSLFRCPRVDAANRFNFAKATHIVHQIRLFTYEIGLKYNSSSPASSSEYPFLFPILLMNW